MKKIREKRGPNTAENQADNLQSEPRMSNSPPQQAAGFDLKSLFREPLLHFLIAGGVLFAAYAWLNGGTFSHPVGADRTVHITAQKIEWMKAAWIRQWQRPPDDRELKGLVNDYLREELLVREARALGLEVDDTIVRQRLVRNMASLIQDTARVVEPAEEELHQFYDANRDQFQTPARVSFTHVFVNRKIRGETAVKDAREILWHLMDRTDTEDVSQIGDRTLLPAECLIQERTAVADQFGADFARAVFAAEPGRWFGPIESEYGLHLVRITEKAEPRPREFKEVRDAVAALLHDQQLKSGEEQFYATLMKRYKVIFDEDVKGLLQPGVFVAEVRQ